MFSVLASFVENSTSKVGKITPTGSITEYTIPTSSSTPQGITTGPDGNLWFTEEGVNKIGKITTSGTITEYSIPTSNSFPYFITSGPDGNVWFTEAGTSQIGKITTSGTITEYATPTSNSIPFGITSGPDGNLWFTEDSAAQIGKITPSGSITEYSTSTSNSTPLGITSGPDGNLWFTEYGASKIGKITTSGSITEYSTPSSISDPYFITLGADGNMWFFTEYYSSNLGKVTPSGSITEYSISSSSTYFLGITSGPDGNIWFTDPGTNKVGFVNLSSMIPSPTPSPSPSPTSTPTPGPSVGPQPVWHLPFPPGTQVEIGLKGLHGDNFPSITDDTTHLTYSFPNTQDADSIDLLNLDKNNTSEPPRPLASGIVLATNSACHFVLIDHGYGWWAIYLHLSPINVKAGDFVNVNTPLGTPFVITTPNSCNEFSSAPHSHFALINGTLTTSASGQITGGQGKYVSPDGSVFCGYQVVAGEPIGDGHLDGSFKAVAEGRTDEGRQVPFTIPSCPLGPGNLWVTGHNADFYCATAVSSPPPQCHYLKVAVEFVMSGLQLPATLPLLVLDHNSQVVKALHLAFGPSGPPIVKVDPRDSKQFSQKKLPLVDAQGNPRFSAIILASDITCGSGGPPPFCDNNTFTSTPDSDAINARASDIATFFKAGGGILALAGAHHISVYYQFLPVVVPPTSVSPSNGSAGGFRLTTLGTELGLVDPGLGNASDINCCNTHNSFLVGPSNGDLKVVENDVAGNAETVIDMGR
jgi:streptogramin lyase